MTTTLFNATNDDGEDDDVDEEDNSYPTKVGTMVHRETRLCPPYGGRPCRDRTVLLHNNLRFPSAVEPSTFFPRNFIQFCPPHHNKVPMVYCPLYTVLNSLLPSIPLSKVPFPFYTIEVARFG